MGFRGARKAVLVATLVALAIAGSAAAQESERGIDPNQGRSLVEVNLPDKAAAIELQLEADDYGIDFNDHYLRTNADGSVTVTVFGNADELAALAGRRLPARHDDRGSRTWRQRAKDWQADAKPRRPPRRRRSARPRASRWRRGRHHRAPRRLLRELRGPLPLRRGEGRPRRAAPRLHRPDARRSRGTPARARRSIRAADDEREHRPRHDARHVHRAPHLVQIGDGNSVAGDADADPDRLEQRHVVEADVQTWLGGGLPPMAANFLRTSPPATSIPPRSTGASASSPRSSRT